IRDFHVTGVQTCALPICLVVRDGLEEFRRLERLGERAAQAFDQPDAGLWEFRGRRAVHTYSSVMCWAACDRLARIATRLGLLDQIGRAACRARAWGAWRG